MLARAAAPVTLRPRRVSVVVCSPWHPLDGQRVEVSGIGRGSSVYVLANGREYEVQRYQTVDERREGAEVNT